MCVSSSSSSSSSSFLCNLTVILLRFSAGGLCNLS